MKIYLKKGNKKMYQVYFDDEVKGEITEDFETFTEAADFYNDYADTETCTGGGLWDKSTGEVIWEF